MKEISDFEKERGIRVWNAAPLHGGGKKQHYVKRYVS
jgi:hypothetical protein